MRERQPPPSLFFFLSDWTESNTFMNGLEERRQNLVRWSRLSVFLWSDVIVSVWNLHPSQRRSAPSDGGSSSESHHKRCGGQAGHRGSGIGEVWFLTQGPAGQGGRTGGQLHYHQRLFTELSPRARLTEQAGRDSNGADGSPILEMLGACVSVRSIRRGHSARSPASATCHGQGREQGRAEKQSETRGDQRDRRT